MEDYLQYMKALRSQMNDVEDQATKSSFEEQMQITTIETLEKDLELAYADIKRLKGETDQMVLVKGQICSQILEKQRKIVSLESDSSSLSQTLELVQQEGVSLHAKLVEKRKYYATITESTNKKLQEQQEWISSYKSCSAVEQDAEGNFAKNLVRKLDFAKSQSETMSCTKSKLLSETTQIQQSIEQVRSKIGAFKAELQEMNLQMLEEENQALLSDRAGETDYLLSLQQQVENIKGISHLVKCSCGEEYNV